MDINDMHLKLGADAVRDYADKNGRKFERKPEANGEAPPDEAPAAKLVYFNECGAISRPNPILKGLIVRGETSDWIGPPKSGKSALVADIGIHCAAGHDFHGHRAKEAC